MGLLKVQFWSPTFSSLCLNDVPDCIKYSIQRMYANDTNISTTGNNFAEIIASVNVDLESISEWLMANKLSLNVAKSDLITMFPKSLGILKQKIGNNTLD